jgi:hypothetical protein
MQLITSGIDRAAVWRASGRSIIVAAVLLSCHFCPVLQAADRTNHSMTLAPGSGDSLRLPEHIEQEVQRRLDYAISLAERGAVLSARSETEDALRLIVRTLDARERVSRRLPLFEASMKQLFDQSMADVPGRTERLRQRYHEATEVLATIVEGQPAAAKALCTLGRLQTMPQSALEQDQQFASARAMALHLAAARTDPSNATAAHELGTLFAMYGQLDQAEFWLRRSTAVTAHSESWDNLATVLERAGKMGEAAVAREHAARIADGRSPRTPDASPAVTWVDAATFNQVGNPSEVQPAAIQLTSETTAPHPSRASATAHEPDAPKTSRWRFFRFGKN